MRPLEGLRVVDLSRVVAGGMAGTVLADLGADVIKVEQPGSGDPFRKWLKEGQPLWWRVYARNKRCITLDFQKPEGKDLLKKLVVDADVVLENFIPGTMERNGIGFDVMRSWNPKLILGSISGWGQTGPGSKRPGFGTLVEAATGLAAMTGDPDGPPMVPSFPLGDMTSALYCVIGVLAALYHRDVLDGEGQQIDVALFESLFSLLGPLAAEFYTLGQVRTRRGNKGNTAPRGCYRTGDNNWVAVSASTPKMAERFLEGFELGHLLKDPRFATIEQRVKNVDELDRMISEAFAKRTIDEVKEIIKKFDLTAMPVQTMREIDADPHWQARQLTVEVEDDAGKIRVHNVFPRFTGTPCDVRWPGRPNIGYDNQAVFCGELGLSKEELDKLSAAGVV